MNLNDKNIKPVLDYYINSNVDKHFWAKIYLSEKRKDIYDYLKNFENYVVLTIYIPDSRKIYCCDTWSINSFTDCCKKCGSTKHETIYYNKFMPTGGIAIYKKHLAPITDDPALEHKKNLIYSKEF